MLDRIKHIFRAPEAKASRTARLIALESPGRARFTPRDYTALAREGFVKNAVAYRAVRLIAEGVGSLTYLVYEGAAVRDHHPLIDLLSHPNPRQDGASFTEAVTAHLLLAGNAYVEAVAIDGAVRELYALRPDRVRAVPGADGWPEAYDYTVAGRSVRFDQAAALPPILHLTLFHPLDDHYGLAPLEAAAVAVDTHNSAAKWNKALLDNAARPSGALVYAGPDGAVLSDAQFERLKRELEDTYQGASNAGRPLLLEGGLDWKAMSLTPKDMDFLQAKHAAAREIALAIGVPPMLLGIPGDNTYANYQEANRAFWRQSVLPLANRLGAALTQWLSPAFGGDIRLVVDTDRIEALSADRAALWERVTAAPFLTVNEKREMLGFGPIAGGDDLPATPRATSFAPTLKFRPDQPRVLAGNPDGGQWTSGGGANVIQPVDMQVAQGTRTFLFQGLLDQGGTNLGTFGNGVSVAVSRGVEHQESFETDSGRTILSFTGRGLVVVDKQVGNEITGSLYTVGDPINRDEGLSIAIDGDGNVTASSTSGS